MIDDTWMHIPSWAIVAVRLEDAEIEVVMVNCCRQRHLHVGWLVFHLFITAEKRFMFVVIFRLCTSTHYDKTPM